MIVEIRAQCFAIFDLKSPFCLETRDCLIDALELPLWVVSVSAFTKRIKWSFVMVLTGRIKIEDVIKASDFKAALCSLSICPCAWRQGRFHCIPYKGEFPRPVH